MEVTGDIVAVLGTWPLGSGPLYRRLALAFQGCIRRGELLPDARLPAERALARALAVSRGTVVAAYDLLRAEGWATSQRGSSTRVLPRPIEEVGRRRAATIGTLANAPWFATLLEESAVPIDLATGTASILPELPATLFALTADDLAPLLAERGYAPLGLPALREAIAARFSAGGLPTTSDEVLVTSGAQQGIALIAAAYLQRGDAVLLENPTYFGALDAFRAAGARPVPVPVDPLGVDVELLRERIVAAAPRLIYLMPTCHNPTGAVMPETHRRAVARLVDQGGIPIAEDHTFAELTLAGAAPPPLAAFARDGHVLTIGSLSKSCWAGLRVGWVRAPAPVVRRLARLKIVSDLGTAVISQAIAARLVARLDQVQRLRREELLPRLALMESLLGDLFPGWTWTRPAGGFFLWVRLPAGDAREFAQVALRHGVAVTPGTALSVDKSHSDHLRLPFLLPPEQLIRGLRHLARAWAAYRPGAGEPPRPLGSVG